MKAKITRYILALMLALSFLGVSTSTVLASPPSMFSGTGTLQSVMTDVCPFSVNVNSVIELSSILFWDKTGSLVKVESHVIEQDTFIANGKNLMTLPYHYSEQQLNDSSGNATHLYINGAPERIYLTDGKLFISAGRVDFMAHPDATFLLSPDVGKPGDVTAFCAALAP